jgi:tRNA(Ile)-lysidine synthetase-like protein
MKLQQVMSYVRKAVDDYQMIAEGDRIAIGISGGKDSMTLLHALHGLQQFYPQRFETHAVSVDLGFENAPADDSNLGTIASICKDMTVPFTTVNTDIARIVFTERQESNPCALCAKLRKGALNKKCQELGLNKVAYAHHKDDAVETMLMSLIFEWRFHSFAPVTYLDRTDLTVIRPLLYMDEADVRGFIRQHDLPIIKNPCPANGQTKREYAKNLVNTLNKENPGASQRLFRALQSSGINGWSI